MAEQSNNQSMGHVLTTRECMWNMAGVGSRQQSICHGQMVEQVSKVARPRQGAGRCHQGKPLVVTENSLLLCARVLPSTCIC